MALADERRCPYAHAGEPSGVPYIKHPIDHVSGRSGVTSLWEGSIGRLRRLTYLWGDGVDQRKKLADVLIDPAG